MNNNSKKDFKIIRGYGLNLLNDLIKTDPSNYPNVNFTNVAMYWRFLTEEMSRLKRTGQLNARNIYLDEASDTVLYFNFGYMLHPGRLDFLTDTIYPYRNFLQALRNILMSGSNPTVLEDNISALIGYDVEVNEFIKDPGKDISDQFGFSFNIVVPENPPSTLDMGLLQRDVSFILDVVKPAHTYFSFGFLFQEEDKLDIKDDELVEIDVTRYLYDSYRGALTFTLDVSQLNGQHLLYPNYMSDNTGVHNWNGENYQCHAFAIVDRLFDGDGRTFILNQSELDSEAAMDGTPLQISNDCLFGVSTTLSSGSSTSAYFEDYFSRIDGVVGNGWGTTSVNVVISSGRVINNEVIEEGMSRPVDFDLFNSLYVTLTSNGSGFGNIVLATDTNLDSSSGAVKISFDSSEFNIYQGDGVIWELIAYGSTPVVSGDVEVNIKWGDFDDARVYIVSLNGDFLVSWASIDNFTGNYVGIGILPGQYVDNFILREDSLGLLESCST